MSIECWHFLPDDGRMQFGERQKVEVGVTYQIDGPIALCECGFHGSRRAIDALRYAPGALCCRVVIGGDTLEDIDKLVGHTRTVLWMVDATRLLHEFACDVAERCLERHGIQDPRCHDAIRTKRLWLDGQATDNELAAAWDAAWDAAWAAAEAAAWDAASDAAWDAAWDAASDAARDAARDAANEDLETRLYALMRGIMR